jgi:L-lysine exporter family protein LysE/ArgO
MESMKFSMQALPVFVQGLTLSLGLIVAIGAQNAFVLRQGLRREHVLGVVLFCVLADVVMMAAGVAGMASALSASAFVARTLALAGGLFLVVYGARTLLRARRAASLHAAGGGAATLRGALAQAAAFTLLNPHFYLDTVLLIGNVGGQQPTALRAWFVAGAGSGSVIWFTALGFGARWLAPWFARPRAWQWLDALTGTTMCALSLTLLPRAFHGF